ncbi:MAG: hypothetical protein WC508_01955 [Patescibacteria group bacterium]
METNNFLQSKHFKWMLGTISAIIILLIVFRLGVLVGMYKANFSYRWGENYHRMFGGPKEGFLKDLPGRDFVDGHGTAGSVIKIEGNSIIVKGQDNIEKNILITDQTTIRRGQTAIKITDIAVDNQIVIIGSPKDDGTIEAKFIRVFDPKNDPMPLPPGPMPGPQF